MVARLMDDHGVLIQDRDSFDLAFNDELQKSENQLTPKQVAFRDDVFRKYLNDNPEVRADRLHKKGLKKGEKDFTLEKDRKSTEEIVQTDKEFIERGSKKVDFAGFDVKLPERNVPKERAKTLRKEIRNRKEFVIPGTVKKKVVFLKKDFVKVKGKEQVRYRDSKGRFGSTR